MNANTQIPPRKVRCIETGIVYESIAETGRQMNIDSSAVGKVCRGKRSNCHGYTFEFVEEIFVEEITDQEAIDKEVINAKSVTNADNISNIRRIKCIQNNKVYESVDDVSKDLNISKTYINRVLRGVYRSTFGYSFEYINEQSADSLINNPAIDLITEEKPKNIKCIQNNKIYKNVNEIFIDLNIPKNYIHKVLRGERKSTLGYSFEYTDETISEAKEIEVAAEKLIRCIETKKEYHSLEEASKDMNIPKDYIRKVLHGQYKSTLGYSFEYINKEITEETTKTTTQEIETVDKNITDNIKDNNTEDNVAATIQTNNTEVVCGDTNNEPLNNEQMIQKLISHKKKSTNEYFNEYLKEHNLTMQEWYKQIMQLWYEITHLY